MIISHFTPKTSKFSIQFAMPPILIQLLTGFIGALFYAFFQEPGYYGATAQLCANVALIPVIAMGVRMLQKRTITSMIATLVIYQTWNMFLEPYLWTTAITTVHRVIRTHDIPYMAFYCMLSVWALYIGFMTFEGRRKKVSLFFSEKKLPLKTIRISCWGAMSLGIIVNIAEFFISALGIKMSFFSMIEQMLPASVLCLTTIYLLRGGRSSLFVIFVIIYAAYNFVIYVGGTLFIYSILLVIAPVATYVVERRKIPVLAIALVSIVLLPIFLTRHQYRNEGLLSDKDKKFELGLEILDKEYLHFDLDRIKESREAESAENTGTSRFEGVSYLSTVVYCHNELRYPWQIGKTFIWLPTMFVPRFLIPFRPSQNMGDDWAEYYKIKDPSWKASLNFPILVEFYANFGYLGMVLLSFLQGWLIGWVCAKFGNGQGDINLLFIVFLMTRLIIVEANITLTYGIIIQVMFVIWLFQKIYGKPKKTAPQRC